LAPYNACFVLLLFNVTLYSSKITNRRLAMLRPYPCRQPEILKKRWFSDPGNDLFVWLNNTGQITAFQFSYNKSDNEHLFSWSEHHGSSHDRIDDGEDVHLQIKMSPIMIPNAAVNFAQLAETFRGISELLKPELVDFIYRRLCAGGSDSGCDKV
jgi:hypothetical protein